MNHDVLFPGELRAIYDAFVTGVTAEGPADEEFKKSQVSFAGKRKFAWLVPQTKRRCLLLLDMYEPQSGPHLRDVIKYRDDKYTHQIEVDSADTVDEVAARGWFRLAYQWGQKA